MTYLTKNMTKELKDWKFKGFISEGYEIVITTQEADVNYISVDLLDEDGELENHIDLVKEYEEDEIEQMIKDGKKVRSEVAKKLDMSTKEIRIRNIQC